MRTRENKPLALLIAVATSAVLCLAGWSVLCRLIATQVAAGENRVESLDKAIRWDPGASDYHLALGRLLRDRSEERDLGRAGWHLRQAVSENPHDWHAWLELARCEELRHLGKTEEAYVRAAELNPGNPHYTWNLANFYLRNGNTDKWLNRLKDTLRLDPDYATIALSLLLLSGMPPGEIVSFWRTAEAPSKPLTLLLTDPEMEWDDDEARELAEKHWKHALLRNGPIDLEEGNSYIKFLLRDGVYAQARGAWISLLADHGLRDPAFEQRKNYVWNGDFSREIPKSVLSWQFRKPAGVSVDLAETVAGGRALRLDFDGTRNLDGPMTSLLVAVDPGRSYRFSYRARSQDLTTDQGPFFTLVDAVKKTTLLTAPPLLGTTASRKQELVFRCPSSCALVEISLSRRKSRKIDSLIGGTLWIEELALATLNRNN